MPDAEELPSDIAPLTKRNAFELSNKRWRSDLERLVEIVRRYDKRWRRAVRRVPQWGLRLAPVVALGAAVAAYAVASGGGSVDKAAKVGACERAHGLSTAQQERAPRAGEAQLSRSQVIAPPGSLGISFSQTTHASCGWPPPPAADPDGYRAITVTSTTGPGVGNASDRNDAELIESRCKALR